MESSKEDDVVWHSNEEDEVVSPEELVLGIDEAGRGPVLGPMIIAGVEVRKKDETKLVEAGVRDSKELSHSSRLKCLEEIKKIAKAIYVIKIYPKELDEKMEFITINRVEMQAMAKIINSSHAGMAIIDLPSNGKKFVESLKARIRKGVELVAEHKADAKYPVVSAASIVAKCIREEEMDKIREKYADYGDIGSGYPADEKTMRFLEDYYKKNGKFPEETRMSWSTVRDVKAKHSQKTLFDV